MVTFTSEKLMEWNNTSNTKLVSIYNRCNLKRKLTYNTINSDSIIPPSDLDLNFDKIDIHLTKLFTSRLWNETLNLTWDQHQQVNNHST